MKNSFGELLRYLIKITESKSKDISAVTLYDASYVSKWLNSKILPSKDEVGLIIEKLTQFFSNKMVIMGIESEFEKIISKDLMLNERLLKAAVSNKLYRAYYESAGIKLMDIKKDKFYIKEPINVFKESMRYINQQVILNESNRLELYISCNVLEMLYKGNIDSFIYFTENNSSIRLNLMLKKLDFRYWSEKKYSYISILSSFFLYNTNVYYEGDFYNDNFIYFVDKGLMSYKFDKEGFAYYMDIVHDDYILNKMKYTCYDQFNEKNLVFKTLNDDKIEYSALLSAYSLKENIYLLTSFYSWNFVDEDTLDYFLNSGKINEENIDFIRNKVKLMDKILESGIEVNIVCDFDSLFYLDRNSTIDFFGNKVKLRKKDNIKYLKHISEQIEKYPNLKVYSLSSFRSLDGVDIYGVNAMLTKEKFVVKKNLRMVHGLDDLYGELLDKNAIDIVYSTVKNDLDTCGIKPMTGEVFYQNCLMYL